MINYNGFEINEHNEIFYNGKRIFKALWQMCNSLKQAKAMIDKSNSEKKRQVSNINLGASAKKLFDLTHEENQERELQREQEKLEQYFLSQHENLNHKYDPRY